MNRQIETMMMPLAGLKPHPLQEHFYSPSATDDDATLAADLRQRGQQSPIVIMPDDNAAKLPGVWRPTAIGMHWLLFAKT